MLEIPLSDDKNVKLLVSQSLTIFVLFVPPEINDISVIFVVLLVNWVWTSELTVDKYCIFYKFAFVNVNDPEFTSKPPSTLNDEGITKVLLIAPVSVSVPYIIGVLNTPFTACGCL